jgi:hypothetical protein
MKTLPLILPEGGGRPLFFLVFSKNYYNNNYRKQYIKHINVGSGLI